VDLDFTGTNGFSDLIDNVDDADNNPNNELITAFGINGSNLRITEDGINWDTPLSSIRDGNNYATGVNFSTSGTTKTLTVNRLGLGNISGSFTDNVNDADANAFNEAWTMYTNGTTRGIINTNIVDFISGNGLQLNYSNPSGSRRNLEFELIDGTATNQILKWNGTTWALATDLTGGTQTLSWDGVDEITISGGNTIDISSVNTNLTQEQVQDFIGSMVSGNTETRISVTYDDNNNEFDFIVDVPNWNIMVNKPAGFADNIDNVNDGDFSPTNEAFTIDADLGDIEVISNQLFQIFGGTDIETNYSAVNNRLTIDYTGGGGGTSDADWFETGGTAPNSINDNIYTQGTVAIGSSSTSAFRLQVSENTNNDVLLYLDQNNSNAANMIFHDGFSQNWLSGVNDDDHYVITANAISDPILIVDENERVGININPSAYLHIDNPNFTNTVDELLIEDVNIGTDKTTRSKWRVSTETDNADLHNLDFEYISNDFPAFPSGTQTLTRQAGEIEFKRRYDDSTNVEMVITVGEYKEPTTGSPYGGYGGERMKFLHRGGIQLFEYSNNGSNNHEFKNNVASRETYEQEIEGILTVTEDGNIVPQHINQIYNDAIFSTTNNTYTVLENHAYITLVGGSNKTVILPDDPDAFAGKTIIIKCNTATQITLDPAAGATVEGALNNKVLTSSDPGIAAQLICLGGDEWRIISQYVVN